MSSVSLVWATPNGENLVGYLARVSNSKAKATDPISRLIHYLVRHKHWSPFEMVNVCVQVECERDISRQILRHRSFSFQEFSGRYAEYDGLTHTREVRLQDHQNRQNSLHCDDPTVQRRWEDLVAVVRSVCWWAYQSAIALGVAKEVARILLPEGLVPTKLYVNGTLRSWIHYIEVRTDVSTQKEHREIATKIKEIICEQYPETARTLEWLKPG